MNCIHFVRVEILASQDIKKLGTCEIVQVVTCCAQLSRFTKKEAFSEDVQLPAFKCWITICC